MWASTDRRELPIDTNIVSCTSCSVSKAAESRPRWRRQVSMPAASAKSMPAASGKSMLVTEATVSWSCCSTVSLAELRSRGFDDEPTWFAAVTGPEWRNGPNSKRNSPTNVVGNKRRRQQTSSATNVVGNKRRRQQTSSANKPREQLG